MQSSSAAPPSTVDADAKHMEEVEAIKREILLRSKLVQQTLPPKVRAQHYSESVRE